MINTKHQPVLLEQTTKFLDPKPNSWYIDATFGQGGHTARMLDLGCRVIAFDFDISSIELGEKKFAQEIEQKKLILIRENFNKISEKVKHLNINIDGILFDFGTNIGQLKSTERGFSFSDQEALLDMRMDDRLSVKASDLLKALPEKHLITIFSEFGGEKFSKKIAKEIVWQRQINPEKLDKAQTLLNIIAKIKKYERSHLHPATKVFQALRIAVNDELNNINSGLPQALEVLKPGARIVCISFHEGEDRIIKNYFKKWQELGLGKILTKKAIIASEQEVQKNPSSRSAKLRAFRYEKKNKN
jgi:16S rRNA (cytosine1402-N4)-methyltransferase